MLSEYLQIGVDYVWGSWLVVLLIITGIYLTIRLKLPQFTSFYHAVEIVRGKFDKKDDPGEITHFQALSAALSATVGLGNIAGVAIAISVGGPGAIVWMWLIGFIGMATKAASCTLAVKYRHFLPSGKVLGGPMHYIEMGLGKKWKPVAVFFAASVAIASFGGGNMFQANQVAAALSDNYDLPREITGIILSVSVALVIIGGIKRIGRVASKLVPFMTIIYIAGAVIVIVMHYAEIPSAISLIFHDAFTGKAAAGGAVGEVIRQGVRRGTFSNESGLGSAPIAHAAAQTKEPVREGLVGLLEPFIDTIVVCSMTALVIIFSSAYLPAGKVLTVSNTDKKVEVSLAEKVYIKKDDKLIIKKKNTTLAEILIQEIKYDERKAVGTIISSASINIKPGDPISFGNGVRLTTAAFDSVLKGFGSYFVSIAVFLFAFSTMLSWSYYGEEGTEYLFGEKGVMPYRILFILAIFIGSIWSINPVMNFSDIAYGLMAVPNVIALWFLSGEISADHRAYFQKIKKV
ncbi:MAG: sodium:alanine symporter family protein [Spirochaetia bacterium]|nr:sodium:alanine symporter family protein [Spirochaetia bacterium]